MRRLLIVLALVSLLIPLSGCGLVKDTPLEGISNKLAAYLAVPGNLLFKRTPENEFQNFMKAMSAQKFDQAEGYLSGKSNLQLSNFKTEKTVFITKTEYEKNDPKSDLATIYYKINQTSGTKLAVMLKENGKWKVWSWGEDYEKDY